MVDMDVKLHDMEAMDIDLVVRQGRGSILALAATGRGNLPEGFNLLG